MAVQKVVLFDGLTETLLAVQGIKKVALWNNHQERENVEQAFLYPAVFIEYLPTAYATEGKGVQRGTMTLRLHICFESYKDEDTAVLNLTQLVYCAVQFKAYGNWSKLDRIQEEQNFDHSNIQDFMQDYRVSFRDDAVNTVPPETVSPDLNIDIDSKPIADDLDC